MNIAIIGRGKVGHSLHQLLSLTNHHTQLIGHTLDDQHAAVSAADVTFITTQDNHIAAVSDTLADSFKLGAIVAHCSGALSSEALASARQRDCSLASIHPLNSFPTLASSLRTFSKKDHNTYLYCEGDPDALPSLLTLALELGFKPIEISQESKTAYHAACVFACNYLTTLMDISLNTAASAGLDRGEFWQAIQPLIQTTLCNINDHGTQDSLSGPIARGDHATIKKHLSALGQHQDSYKQLGIQTLRIAAQRGELSQQDIDRISALLADG